MRRLAVLLALGLAAVGCRKTTPGPSTSTSAPAVHDAAAEEHRPPVPDPRVPCPAGTTPGSRYIEIVDVSEFWCEDADGWRHGSAREFRGDGQLWTDKRYDHGLEDGVQRTYHPNGKLEQEQRSLRGITEGLNAKWDEEGKPAFRGEWREDEPVGTWRWWNDGKVSTRNSDEPNPEREDEFEEAQGSPDLVLGSVHGVFAVSTDGRLRAVSSDGEIPIPLPLAAGVKVTRAWATKRTVVPQRDDPLIVLALEKDGKPAGLALRLHVIMKVDGGDVNHPTLRGVRWVREIPFAPGAPKAWGRILYLGGAGAMAKVDLLDGKLCWTQRGLGDRQLVAASYDGQGHRRLTLSADGEGPRVEVVLDERTGKVTSAAKAP